MVTTPRDTLRHVQTAVRLDIQTFPPGFHLYGVDPTSGYWAVGYRGAWVAWPYSHMCSGPPTLKTSFWVPATHAPEDVGFALLPEGSSGRFGAEVSGGVLRTPTKRKKKIDRF